MNIFATSPCPVKSAKILDDKRVIKMILESAQLMSTAIREHGGEAPYKTTHKNHPSAIWARKTRANYIWLLEHFEALCDEYTERYGKVHKSFQYIMDFEYGITYIPQGTLTEMPKCMPDEIKVDDVYESYQLYMIDKWKNDKRTPTWYREHLNNKEIFIMLDELDEV